MSGETSHREPAVLAFSLAPAGPLMTRADGQARGVASWSDRAWDVAAILTSWFGGLLLVGEAVEVRGLSDQATLVHLVAGFLFTLALWWRRDHPIPVALFLGVVSTGADGAGIAAVVALYTVVSRRRGRAVVAIIVLNVVAAIGYAVLYPDPQLPLGVSFVLIMVLTAAILATTVAFALLARARRELVESLRERATRAEEEARLRADRLRALERERIAREMHDALAHSISMVSLHAGALQIRPDLTPEEIATAAATIRDSAHQALEDLREILGVLRADSGDGLRPQPDLRDLAELVADAQRAGVQVGFTDHLGGLAVSASMGRTVYRLVQEGLTNAGKHASGAPVTVLLEHTADGDLHVRLANRCADGGAAPTGVPGAGNGLVGLAERVALVDGRFRHGVRGDPGTGLTFVLEAWLPWPVIADSGVPAGTAPGGPPMVAAVHDGPGPVGGEPGRPGTGGDGQRRPEGEQWRA